MGWWGQDGRDDTLRRLVGEGYSASQIAEKMGAVSANAVIGRAHREGIPLGDGRRVKPARRPKKADPRQEAWRRDEPILRQMHAAGASPMAIAERLGRPYFQVTDKARALGLRWPRRRATPKPESAAAPPAKSKPNWTRPSPSTPRAAPTPLPRAVRFAVSSNPVPFLDRRIGQCCWPLWEPPARTGPVCGAATGSVAASYCTAHRALAFNPRAAA